MAAINLWANIERPLTIQEVDHNFDAINREVGTKLDAVAFNATNVLNVLNNNAGAGSTLDADKVHGKYPNTAALPNTVAIRDGLGHLYAVQFYGLHVGDVIGNLTGAVTGSLAGNATNVDGVVQLDHGGTGAVNATTARSNLGCGNMAIQNKSEIDITGGTITGITDITVADGGTGASTATGARSNLGLVIGQDVQAYAAILSGVSATSGNGLVIRTDTNSSVVREIKVGNSLSITNGNGKDGNPTISLNADPAVSSISHTGTNGSGDIGQTDNRFNKAYINGLSVNTATAAGAGEIIATGNITAYYSDDNLKTRLGNIENALDKIDTLTGFYYEANATAQELGYTAKREVGLSAQSTQKVMPEIVSPAPIDDQYLTIDYSRFAPLLVEGIKELRVEINKIKTHIGL
jgi:hypothetical protein